jgi:hypothetical protein
LDQMRKGRVKSRGSSKFLRVFYLLLSISHVQKIECSAGSISEFNVSSNNRDRKSYIHLSGSKKSFVTS